jgi:uncharacterized protein YbaP (TraB family)
MIVPKPPRFLARPLHGFGRRLLSLALLALPAAGLAEPQQRLPRPVPPVLAPVSVAAETAAKAPSATPVASLKPALWLVRDKDTQIYLFGTIHVLAASAPWFEGRLAQAFAASDTLVTEVGDIGGLEAAQSLLQGAQLPPGQTLRGRLSPADRTALEAAAAKAGIPITALDRFKPWYAAVVLSSLPLIRAGYRLDQGVEMQLATRARDAGKKQEALETAAYQLALFDSLPEPSQIAYLRQVVDNFDQVTQQIGTLVSEWGQGDADGLAAVMNADKSDPALVEALLTRRNAAWADWIKARLARPGTLFVAVGAGHLAGPQSVQTALAQRGIKAARVQ